MNDKEYLNRLLQSTYATSSFLDFANIMARKDLLSEAIADAKAVKETALANAKLAFKEGLKPKVVSYKAWDTLRSWMAELIIVDGNQIDITYSKRDKSEIRITIQHIDSQRSDVYHLSEDDIGVAVLPERISKLLREVWNKKELEKCQSDSEYFMSRYTYVMGIDPYEK